MKIRTVFLLCVISLCSALSWGQTWNLTSTMRATLSNGTSTVTTMAGTNVCEILDDKEYADLGDALAAVKNNQTIKLLQNINYNKADGIEIDGKSITFDLNGFNLNVVAKETALYVSNGEVKLTGTGEFNVTSDLIGVRTDRGGKATVTNATSTGKSDVSIGISGVHADNNSTVTVLGNVTSEYNSVLVNIAVFATHNSTVMVYGNVAGYDYGTCAYYNSTVTVNCNVTAKDRIGTAVNTIENSIVTVHGNVTGSNRGVSADNANVTVGGDVITTGGNVQDGIDARNGSIVKVAGDAYGAGPSGGYGVYADSGSNVSVGGDAIGTSCGVRADGNKTTVTVSGIARGYEDFIGSTREYCGIRALDGANVTVTGSAIGTYGIYADGRSNVSTGSVIGRTYGVRAKGSSNVSVTSGVTGGRYGIYVSDNNTTVAVSGDVSGSGQDGIYAEWGSKVTVTGDVIGDSYGVSAINSIVNVSGSATGIKYLGLNVTDNSTVTIGGDVIGNGGVAIQYGGFGVNIQDINKGSEVTIDGQIIVKEPQNYSYIKISDLALSHSDNQPTSSKPDYLEYTDGKSYVWVKETITGTDIIPQPSSPLKASVRNGRLYVSGLTVGDLWTVYNLYGMIVHQNRAAAEEADINLPTKGIYLIVSAGKSAKAGNF